MTPDAMTPDTQPTSANQGATDRSRPAKSPASSPTLSPTSNPAGQALAVATVLVGLSAGFFHSYEASVTLGLAEVGDAAYVETFQSINETIRNPAFGIVFFGSVPAIVLAAVANWRNSSSVARSLLAVALGLYLACMAVTVSGNVPLNNELAEVAGAEPGVLADARADFEEDWNRLNLIRTVFVIGSLVALAAVPLTTSDTRRRGRLAVE